MYKFLSTTFCFYNIAFIAEHASDVYTIQAIQAVVMHNEFLIRCGAPLVAVGAGKTTVF